MIQNEALITKWAPALLLMELDNVLWTDNDNISIKKLWDYLCTYCYLPRLANYSVLEDAIMAGVNSTEYFALAAGISGERYLDLKYNVFVGAIDRSAYLVKALAALKQITQEKREEPKQPQDNDNPKTPFAGGGTSGGNGGTTKPVNPEPPKPASDTRFFMNVKLDNTRVIRDLQKYLDEVISHLSSVDNCEVELSLEVTAQAKDGFPQGTVRTVSENCRTLRISNFGFEK